MTTKAISCGDLILIGGQSFVTDPPSPTLVSQVRTGIDAIATSLDDINTNLQQLVKLLVFYRPQAGVSEMELRELLSAVTGDTVATAVTFVPVRELCNDGALIEIEAYAMHSADRTNTKRMTGTLPGLLDPVAGFCHGLRCGDFVFVSGQTAKGSNGQVQKGDDLVTQNRQVLAHIRRILDDLDVSTAEIVKANTWRAPPPTYAQYAAAAQDRFQFFKPASPALTGITVPQVSEDGVLITIDAWAMAAANGESLARRRINPDSHWNWSSPTPYSHGLSCGDYLFVGGQAALDAEGGVLHPHEMAAQTELTMHYVEQVLRAGGAGLDNIVKTSALYTGAGNPTNLASCVDIIQHRVGQASATTVIPVDELAYPGQTVEVEAIAYLPA